MPIIATVTVIAMTGIEPYCSPNTHRLQTERLMISLIRRWLTSWIVLGILGLILIAFIITGVEGPGAMGGGGTGAGASIAEIGGSKVTTRELIERVQNQFEGARRDQPGLDQKAFADGGGFEGVTDALISGRALERWGRDEGFAIGKRLVDAQIASFPAFRGVTGQFDEMVMRNALAQARLSEKQLRDDLATDLIRAQILTPVTTTIQPSANIVRPYARLLVEERKGMVGIIPHALLIDPRRPTDAEIDAAYKANVADYTQPEARVLRYALFGAEQVAAQAAPTDEDISQYYRDNSATYGARETRDLAQVIAPDEAIARSIAATAKDGGSLAAAAAKAGLEAVTLPAQNRADYAGKTSEAIAGQVFGAGRGDVIGPVKGAFGWYVIRVDNMAATQARSIDEARAEIVAALTSEKVNEALADLGGNIEDAIADGASFAEVVAANRLPVTETPALLANGQPIDQTSWQAPPELASLLGTGFEMSADDRPAVETVVRDQTYALLTVAKVIPPAPVPLAEIRDVVARDIIARRAAERAEKIGREVTAAVNRGVPLAKALADSGARLPPPQAAAARQLDLARAQQNGTEIPAPVRALFSMQRGKARLVPGDRGNVLFVTVLTEIIPGNLETAPGLVESSRQELGASIAAELGEQFVRSVAAQIEVKRYPEAIAEAKRQFAGAQ